MNRLSWERRFTLLDNESSLLRTKCRPPGNDECYFLGTAETIENDAVFDRFGAVFDRLGAVFDRLGSFFNRKRRRNEAFEFDSNCQAPQRAWQFESNSNATV